MTPDVIFALRFLATLGCGLMAGLFFAFSVSVMPALARRPAAEGMAAMQAINVAIINPLFVPVFMGTALVSVLVLIAALLPGSLPGEAAAAGGAACYLGGIFLVTIVANVPMNNALAALAPAAPGAAETWARYLRRWTAWNHVRTVSGVAGTAALMLALAG